MKRTRIIRGRRYVLPPPGASAGHAKPGNRGSRNAAARLTEDDVAAIRLMARQGDSYRELAAGFAVSSSTISRAVNQQTWRHA
jgi:DNA invertase Pin-like site-specific DNA recombinase